MKWFKHFAQAHRDEKLVIVRDSYGMWGIGAYWSLLEYMAEQMKGKNPEPKATITMQELSSYLVARRQKIVGYLVAIERLGLIQHVINGNLITISCPKLLHIKDNYSKDLEESPKELPSKEVEGEVEGEVDKSMRQQAESLISRWNAFAPTVGLQCAKKLTDARRDKITKRLKEQEFNLEQIFTEIRQSKFMQGNNKNGWKVDFDFIVKSESNYIKILEGKYRDTQKARVEPPMSAMALSDMKRSQAQ